MWGWDDRPKYVYTWSIDQYVIRGVRLNQKVPYPQLLRITPYTQMGPQINIPSSVHWLAREAYDLLVVEDDQVFGQVHLLECLSVEDVYWTPLINKHLTHVVPSDLDNDNHRIVLIQVRSMEILIWEGSEQHEVLCFVHGVNNLQASRVPFAHKWGRSATYKPSEDGVYMIVVCPRF